MRVHKLPAPGAPWFRRPPWIALLAVVCMGATYSAGREMERWRLKRIHTLDDAHEVPYEAPTTVRLKAMVAIQRECRRGIEKLRVLASDPDQEIAANARDCLASVEQSLR